MYFLLYLLDEGLAWERVFSFGAPLLGMQILGPPLGGRRAPSSFQSGLSLVCWGKAGFALRNIRRSTYETDF